MRLGFFPFAELNFGAHNFQFNGETKDFGNCFTPPWQACCGDPVVKQFAFQQQVIPLLQAILELRVNGGCKVTYQIYKMPSDFMIGQQEYGGLLKEKAKKPRAKGKRKTKGRS